MATRVEKWVPLVDPRLKGMGYEISDMGRIKNRYGAILKNRETKLRTTGNIRLVTQLICKDGKQRRVQINTLVFNHFYKGELPNVKKFMVQYRDGNPTNCRIENLYPVPHSTPNPQALRSPEEEQNLLERTCALARKGYSTKAIVKAVGKYRTEAGLCSALGRILLDHWREEGE